MFRRINKAVLLSAASAILLIFLLAIDATPYLRGPIDSNLASRWPYYFVNTFSKVWIFAPIILGYFLFIKLIENRKFLTKKNELFSLFFLVILTFTFQIALVYFSRFGITILFRRLVDPGINGYFMTAVNINNIINFVTNFPDLVNARHLAQHASGHTPGAVLLINFYIYLASFIPSSWILHLNSIHPGWAKGLWDSLSLHQKFAALSLPFLLHLFSSLVIIPFYFVAKAFSKDIKTSLKTTAIYSVIPSFSFFALIFDPIYSLFPLLSTLLIFIGVKKRQSKYFLLSGIICGVGLFFTAAILTYIIGLLVFTLMSYRTALVKWVSEFALGIFSVVIVLYIAGFNLITSLIAVVHNQASRDYLPWLIFNPYDFFLFSGFCLSLIFLYQTLVSIRHKFELQTTYGKFLLTFWVVFISLIVSGASRGEVGRIWLPFMFIPVLIVGYFVNYKLKITNNQFVLILMLTIIQTIIMEEFWVPIW